MYVRAARIKDSLPSDQETTRDQWPLIASSLPFRIMADKDRWFTADEVNGVIRHMRAVGGLIDEHGHDMDTKIVVCPQCRNRYLKMAFKTQQLEQHSATVEAEANAAVDK